MPGPTFYSSDSPQVRAAKVSGYNRARRARERGEAAERPAEYLREHERGEHDDIILVGCSACEAERTN